MLNYWLCLKSQALRTSGRCGVFWATEERSHALGERWLGFLHKDTKNCLAVRINAMELSIALIGWIF